MPQPTPDWDMVELRGKLVGTDGVPMRGRIGFTPATSRMKDLDQLTDIVGRTVWATLTADGTFTIQLPATDDPDITPTGFTYRVTEELTNGGSLPAYDIAVPLAAKATGIEYTLVSAEGVSTPGSPSYVAEVLQARAEAVASAQAAQDAQAAAETAAATATAPTEAQIAAVDADPASAFRIQQDARSAAALAGKLDTAARGADDGVAPLDADGLLPEAHVPGRLAEAAVTASIVATTGAGASGSTQTLMRKLAAGADANLVVLTDSTGDSASEWPYLLGQVLGGRWAQHRVIWYPAAASGIGYGADVTIQAPAGYTGTLRVWAHAISGGNSYLWQAAAQFNAAVLAPAPDAVFISLGHNEGGFTGDPNSLGTPQQAFRLRILAVAEQIRQTLPAAGIVLIAQNAWQDDGGDMGIKRDELRMLAQARGYGFLDVYQAYVNHPNRATLYLDNVHPNAAGQAVYRDVIARAFRALPNDEPRPMPPSLFDTSGAATLVDDLVLPGGSTVPIGWTAVNATVIRDTARYETARGYAIRLTPTATGSVSRIQRLVLDSAQLAAYRGRWITIAVRVWRAAGGVGNRWVGRMGVSDGVKSSLTLGDDFSVGGSFVWRFLPHLVDPASTGLTVYLYCDLVGDATDPTVTFERLMVIPGEWPAGFAPRAAPDAWLPYTPQLVGFTGTVNHARYRLAGNSCRVVGQVTLNAVPTGTLDVSLPTPALTAAQTGRIPMGSAVAWDIGTGAKQGNALLTSSGTGGRIQFIGENGTWNATIPHVWATNDVIGFQLEYEINAG